MSATFWVTCSIASAATSMALTTARSTLADTIIFALVPIIFVLGSGLRPILMPLPSWVIAGSIGWLYLAISVLWAADIRQSVEILAFTAALLTLVYIASKAIQSAPINWFGHILRSFLLAYAICLLFGFIEETTNHQIKQFIFWPFRATSWSQGVPTINWSYVVHIRSHISNWNISNLSLMLWPALLISGLIIQTTFVFGVRVILVLLAMATALQSAHQSSVMALAAGLTIFGMASLWRKFTTYLIAAAWMITLATAIPLSSSAFDAKLHLAKWAPFTTRHRVVIWKYTGDLARQRPIFGVGVGSTAPLDQRRRGNFEKPTGFPSPLRTYSHAHNIYLQAWYELGAIGVLALLIFGLSIIRTISLQHVRQQPYLLAAFATVATMSTTSFGLFEPWFVGSLAFTAMTLSFGLIHQQRTQLVNS